MSSFTFNGISSTDLGIIITSPPFRPSWTEEKEEIEVLGRPAKLRRATGVYANQDLRINAVISDCSKIHDIYSALQGRGKLRLSTAPAEYLICDALSLVPEGVALEMAEIPLVFTCEPFAYAVDPTVIDISSATEYVKIDNAGTVKGRPIITFKPSGTSPVTITTNDDELIVKIPETVSNGGYAITIDSEIMIAYYTDADGSKISCTEYTTGHFPLLHVGENYIKYSGEISEMNINMNERWF